MHLFDYLFSFATSGLIMSSALPVQDKMLPHSSSTQVGMIIFPKLESVPIHTTSTKRKIASSKGSKALIAPQNIPDRQLKASPKIKGKKSKKADCKTKNSKSPKSAKNIFKKNKVGKLKLSCFRVSSKAPNRLGPGPQPKRPGAFVQDPTVNIARTSSIGTTVQVAFNGSLTFLRFPHPRSQDQTSTVISVLTSALKSILPDGSSVELTGLSNKTLGTSQYSTGWNNTNKMVVMFSTVSHEMECAGVSCIQAAEQLYNETTQALQQSVMDSSLVDAIQNQALAYQTGNFKHVRVNPQSLHVGNYRLVATNQRDPSSQYLTSSTRRQMTGFTNTILISSAVLLYSMVWL